MSTPTDNKPEGQYDLNQELNQLGKQLEQVVRTALQSDRARTIQREITTGIEQMSTQFQTLAERGQQAVNQTQKALDQAQEQTEPNTLITEFQDALARGVSQINQQLAEFATRMQSQNTSNGPSAQHVPVEDEVEEDEPVTKIPPSPTPSTPVAPPSSVRSAQSVKIESDESDEDDGSSPPPVTGETTRLDS